MKQFIRYAIVGIISNLFGYLAYILLTFSIFESKIAMTLVYAISASVSFFGNRKWTFNHQGKLISSAFAYWAFHFCGYAINYSLLYIFVDRLSYPHQLVQAFAIGIVAIFLFFMFRYVVFATPMVSPQKME